MSTFRRVLGYAWIPAITWLGSIGVAEGVFRGLGKWPSNNVGDVYESFGEGSFKHRPNCAVRENWFSGEFFIYTDDLGLRFGDRPDGGVKPGRRVDILVLGDSQGFGNGVDFEDSIVGVLQSQAQAAGVTVANASVGGHLLRNQIELAKWLRHVRDLEFRSILLLLTPRMIFEADRYVRATVSEDGLLYKSRPTLVARIRAWLRTHSSIYVVVRDAYRSTGAGAGDESSHVNFYRLDDGRGKGEGDVELSDYGAHAMVGGHRGTCRRRLPTARGGDPGRHDGDLEDAGAGCSLPARPRPDDRLGPAAHRSPPDARKAASARESAAAERGRAL